MLWNFFSYSFCKRPLASLWVKEVLFTHITVEMIAVVNVVKHFESIKSLLVTEHNTSHLTNDTLCNPYFSHVQLMVQLHYSGTTAILSDRAEIQIRFHLLSTCHVQHLFSTTFSVALVYFMNLKCLNHHRTLYSLIKFTWVWAQNLLKFLSSFNCNEAG